MAVADVNLLSCISLVLAKCCVGYLVSDLDNSSLHTQLLIGRRSHWLETTLA